MTVPIGLSVCGEARVWGEGGGGRGCCYILFVGYCSCEGRGGVGMAVVYVHVGGVRMGAWVVVSMLCLGAC